MRCRRVEVAGWHIPRTIAGMSAPSDLIDEVLASDLVDDTSRSAAVEPAQAEVTARRRRLWAKHATLASVTLGLVGSFLAISRTIGSENGNRFDRSVVRKVGQARHPVGSAIMRGITFFGSAPGAAAVSVSAIALARRRPRLVWQLVSGALGGLCAELILKRIFQRERPRLLAHLEKVRSTSFPSGHSMASSSLYLTLAFVGSRSRRLQNRRTSLLTGAGTFATLIGATRIYLGVHWPTDVLGGLALGTAWACAAEAIFDLTGAERIEREAVGASSPPLQGHWTLLCGPTQTPTSRST
ncbi:MAG: phosphoesterase PA-phosphatase related [Labilithrix sp.]|nr:phosphoesterase PA-phosphatase related [Labilithrix sp.]